MDISHITNADVYLEETNLVGLLKEVDFGEIAHAEVEHETLGQVGILKLPGRPLQAIDATLTWNYLDDALMPRMYNPAQRTDLFFHHKVDAFDETGLNPDKSKVIVTLIGFMPISNSGMTPKLGEALTKETNVAVHRFRQAVRGAEIPVIDFDIWSGLYQINGVDVWPN